MTVAPARARYPGEELSRGRRLATIVVLGMLTALGPFTIDLYLPAFPQLATDLAISDAQLQLTLSATTLGFATGQLLLGPLSDRIGRRVPLMVTTSLHIAASIGVAIAPDVWMLTGLRVLQGVGAAGGAVVAMAMVRDLFGGKPLVRMLSRLALVMGLAPILAPIIGSWLLAVTEWRGIFWVLAGYGALVIVLVVVTLRETLSPSRRIGARPSSVLARYRIVLGDRRFLGVAVIGACAFGGMFAYLATSSLLVQEVYGLDATQFGLVFALCSVGVFVGTQSSSRLATRVGPQWVLAASTALMLITGALIVLFDALGLGLAGLVPPMATFAFAFGCTMPCVQVLALANHARQAGTAASLLGAGNMALASLVGPVIGAFTVTNAIPMGAVMVVCSLIATASLWIVVRPGSVPPLSD